MEALISLGLSNALRQEFLIRFGRYPATHELNKLIKAYTTHKEKQMATWRKYIAVFNTNPGGNVVARLVSVSTNELNLSETQILESARRKIVQRVQDSLPDRHEVVGVSNLMPSQYGQGGAYIFPIKIIPPRPPEPVIEMGPAIKSLHDLQDNPPGDARMSSGYYS